MSRCGCGNGTCPCRILAGTHISITGDGSSTNPFTINTTPSAAGIQIVRHGTAGATPRPAGAVMVYWQGTATPTNALVTDLWYKG